MEGLIINLVLFSFFGSCLIRNVAVYDSYHLSPFILYENFGMHTVFQFLGLLEGRIMKSQIVVVPRFLWIFSIFSF